MRGAFWVWVVVGILLLGGMFVGAQWMGSAAGPKEHKKGDTDAAADTPPMIVSWGFFDVQPGVAALYPKQFGDVVKLVSENTKVKEGEVLLQVQDKMAESKVDEAKAAVKAAEQQVAEAKQLPEFNKLQKEQQVAMIKSIDFEVDKLQKERKTKEDSVEKSSPLYKTIQELYNSGIAQLGEKKKAEQAKLKQLELQDANLKINQADAELSAKEAQLKQAVELLEHFKVRAPSDGTVLRVYAHKGETLGPNPRIQAIDFLPDAPIIVRAEVLQEWARHVKVGQEVVIEDDIFNGPKWEGTVKSISKWYAPTRTPVIEPFRYNDVRTLECIIEVKDGGNDKMIGQRVRAKIKIAKAQGQ